ncbi:MAG: hypothetical protein A2826_00815 [Candidatus Doudnabacteria bacterium RIFCSPHIGHO2_01_FULL_43_23]|uniref:Uncharacterized protein n=1 Tax=Candidatus Doudnabacteria bacterium RIFCSPHIGHO2_01_FULL_43_23 TaxID=1817822 RepID=A0A1F5NRU0_9BACT|nr:MAG: hypothetical protein A2826_00815 [Candidatus Doudnabacteria bacterium RIFCSPHIGHO2_01_FULL_43_23]
MNVKETREGSKQTALLALGFEARSGVRVCLYGKVSTTRAGPKKIFVRKFIVGKSHPLRQIGNLE